MGFGITAVFVAGLFVRIFFQPLELVVPHHNVVSSWRKELMAQVSRQRPITKSIILVSPDHFSLHQRGIYYGDIDYVMLNGQLKFDHKLATKLKPYVTLGNNQISKDHGITNILGDIQDTFPQAKVFPVIIGQKVALSQLNGLSQAIEANCGFDCLFVASVDFSHYLPWALADCHDATSLRVLNNLAVDETYKMEVDSQQALYLLMKLAELKNAQFTVFAHTNAARLENNRDAESTSHIMGWYQRRWRHLPMTQSTTFQIATNINQSSGRSLGERFFYGVDYQDNSFAGELVVAPNLLLTATTSASVVGRIDDRWNIAIGQDLVVCGLSENNSGFLSLLPINQVHGSYELLKGKEKTVFLDQFLSGFDNSRFKVDKGQGILNWGN